MPFYKNNVLFIHIPKTSGTYIEEKLKKYEIDNNYGYVKSLSTYRQHLTYKQYCEIYGNKINECFIFTIIRDPFDRLYSAYKQRFHSNSDHQLIEMMNSINFEDFVINKLENILNRNNTYKGNITHILPQCEFIKNSMNNVKLIKYDNLNSLSEILTNYNLSTDIKFNNKNKYINEYSDIMIEKIKFLYKEDFDLYNSL